MDKSVLDKMSPEEVVELVRETLYESNIAYNHEGKIIFGDSIFKSNETKECPAMERVEGGIPYCSDKQIACDSCKLTNDSLTKYEISVVRQLIADGLSNEQIFNVLKEM